MVDEMDKNSPYGDKYGLYLGEHPHLKKLKHENGIQNKSRFSHLSSHALINGPSSDESFLNHWFTDYYLDLRFPYPENWVEKMKVIKYTISEDVVLELLGNLGWRQRCLGAYYSMVLGNSDLIDIIGVHLLKSEMPHAGYFYLVAIAYFNDKKGIDYLNQYLDYYLTQYTLDFNQLDAINTLCYLDKLNNTDLFKEFESTWEQYKIQSNRELQINYKYLENEIQVLNEITQKPM